MSYIFVVDEDKLTEESFSAFLSGEGSILFYKDRVREVSKMDLEEYCLDCADKLYKENIVRLKKLSESEREEIFCDDNCAIHRSVPGILYLYKPSEVKKRLDKYENKQLAVGDVIAYSFNHSTVTALITKIEKVNGVMGTESTLAYLIRKDGTTDLCILGEDGCEKTGRHYDSIDEFMKGE